MKIEITTPDGQELTSVMGITETKVEGNELVSDALAANSLPVKITWGVEDAKALIEAFRFLIERSD